MVLFHCTNGLGMTAIVRSEILRPSRMRRHSKDVRYGNGQYFSDIVPGSLTPAQLSRALLGMPFQGHRFTHFVAIDMRGLTVMRCRPGVFLVANEFALSLSGRIVEYGGVSRE